MITMLQIILCILSFQIVLCDDFDDFLLWSQKSLSSKLTTSYIISDTSHRELQNVTQISNGLFNMQANLTQAPLKFGDIIFIQASSSIPAIELSQRDFKIEDDSQSWQLDKAPLLIPDGNLIYEWTKHVINLLQQYEDIAILPVITDSNYKYESSCDGYSIFILDPRCSVRYVLNNNKNTDLDVQTKKCLPYSVQNIPYKSQILAYKAKSPLYFDNNPVDGFYTRECTQKWVLCGKHIRMRPRIIIFVKRKTTSRNEFNIPPLSTDNYFCSCSQNFTSCRPSASDILSNTLTAKELKDTSLFISINERRACYTFKDCYYFKSVSNMYKEVTDMFKLNSIQSMLPINVTCFTPLKLTETNASGHNIPYQLPNVISKIKTARHVIIGMTILLLVLTIFIIFAATANKSH